MNSARQVSYQNKGKGTIINLEQGKLPPQAIDLEEAVLEAGPDPGDKLAAAGLDQHQAQVVVSVLHLNIQI